MTRELDTETLHNAARDYAQQFVLPTIGNPTNSNFAPIAGRGWVMASMYNFHFKDEFSYVLHAMQQFFTPKMRKVFDFEASHRFTPRSDETLAYELAERLAITPDGKPILGKIGTVNRGSAIAGFRYSNVFGRSIPRIVKAAIYVGETTEEAVERVCAMFARQNTPVFPMTMWPASMALATRISNEVALLACDSIVDRLDEGTAGGIIRILDGTQATDPDTVIGAQVTLAVLPLSDPAFGSAADANPGGRATASAITSDSSADATGTASWFRASASNDGATSLDDHIDGSVGTSGCDMNLNTVSIVSGATVSISSWTVTMPES